MSKVKQQSKPNQKKLSQNNSQTIVSIVIWSILIISIANSILIFDIFNYSQDRLINKLISYSTNKYKQNYYDTSYIVPLQYNEQDDMINNNQIIQSKKQTKSFNKNNKPNKPNKPNKSSKSNNKNQKQQETQTQTSKQLLALIKTLNNNFISSFNQLKNQNIRILNNITLVLNQIKSISLISTNITKKINILPTKNYISAQLRYIDKNFTTIKTNLSRIQKNIKNLTISLKAKQIHKNLQQILQVNNIILKKISEDIITKIDNIPKIQEISSKLRNIKSKGYNNEDDISLQMRKMLILLQQQQQQQTKQQKQQKQQQKQMIPIQQDQSQQQSISQYNTQVKQQQQFEEEQQQDIQEISQQFVVNLSSYLQPIKNNHHKHKLDLSHFFQSNHQSQQIHIHKFLSSIQNHHHQLSTISQSLQQLQSTLIQLDLSYNDLTLSHLQQIIKSLQQHQQVPFNSIKSINLSFNKINNLQNILSNFEKLQQLHLQNNPQLTFQTLSKLSIKKIKTLSKLYISFDSLVTENYQELNSNQLTQKYKQFINNIKINWPKFQQLIIYSSSQQNNQHFPQQFKQTIENYAWQKTSQLQDNFIILWK